MKDKNQKLVNKKNVFKVMADAHEVLACCLLIIDRIVNKDDE